MMSLRPPKVSPARFGATLPASARASPPDGTSCLRKQAQNCSLRQTIQVIMLRNSASGPEIGLLGRISAGFWSGKFMVDIVSVGFLVLASFPFT